MGWGCRTAYASRSSCVDMGHAIFVYTCTVVAIALAAVVSTCLFLSSDLGRFFLTCDIGVLDSAASQSR